MEQFITLALMIILTIVYLRHKSNQTERRIVSVKEVSDGCGGYILALLVLGFVIISMIYQKELLDACGKRFIE